MAAVELKTISNEPPAAEDLSRITLKTEVHPKVMMTVGAISALTIVVIVIGLSVALTRNNLLGGSCVWMRQVHTEITITGASGLPNDKLLSALANITQTDISLLILNSRNETSTASVLNITIDAGNPYQAYNNLLYVFYTQGFLVIDNQVYIISSVIRTCPDTQGFLVIDNQVYIISSVIRTCPDGSFDPICYATEDECANNHTCHNAATCVDNPLNYTCTCNTNYYGDGIFCQQDPCLAAPCDFNASCVWSSSFAPPQIYLSPSQNSSAGRVCMCSSGFSGDGEINNCTEVSCPPFSEKLEVNSTCTCLNGYEGNVIWDSATQTYNSTCVEIDECTMFPCSQICVNTVGSYFCACYDGFILSSDTACDEVQCPTNSAKLDNSTCKCAVGYDGTISWNNQTFTFDGNCQDVDECTVNNHNCEQVCYNTTGSFTCGCTNGYAVQAIQCVAVLCPADSSNLTQGVCECNPGFNGTITWNSAYERYDGACNVVNCPANSVNSSASTCVCAQGFSGTITWNSVSRQYDGVCNEVACPANATKVNSECVCNTGYQGNILWNAGFYEGSCAEVVCPANANKGVDGSCVCGTGYSGIISWNAANSAYLGQCIEVLCPPNTTKNNNNCACGPGFSGSVAWNSTISSYVSFCTEAPCPGNSTKANAAECICNVGYTGSIVWNAGFYIGSCSEVSCPSDATKQTNGNCACNDGFTGTISWDSANRAYAGLCTGVSCPGNSTKNVNSNCVCDTGFIGTITWNRTSGVYDGVCSVVTCPTNSIKSNDNNCACVMGYSGTITWNSANMGYDGVCTDVPCPSNSTKSNGECTCNVGFTGTILWNDGFYLGECQVVDCPSNSIKDSSNNCNCNAGYSGMISWNSRYEGICTAVSCPVNASQPSAAVCSCNSGYVGNVTWNATTQGFDGSCQDCNIACDDGIACTIASCSSTHCLPPLPQNSLCNDNIACTDDYCDLNQGCLFDPYDDLCPPDQFCSTSSGCAVNQTQQQLQQNNLIITEFSFGDPQWIELYVKQGSVDLSQYFVKNQNNDKAMFYNVSDLQGMNNYSIIVNQGEYVYGIVDNGSSMDYPSDVSFVIKGVSGNFNWSSDGDVIVVYSKARKSQDYVAFTPVRNKFEYANMGLFPIDFSAIKSTQLSLHSLSTIDNDMGSNWCISLYPYTSTPRTVARYPTNHTRGQPNIPCNLLYINEIRSDPLVTSPVDQNYPFVELYGPPGALIQNISLQQRNISDGSVLLNFNSTIVMGRIPLNGLILFLYSPEAPDEFIFSEGSFFCQTCMFDVSGDTSIQVIDVNSGEVLDAVGWNQTSKCDVGMDLYQGSCVPYPGPAASLARRNLINTHDNSMDFYGDPTPTPKAPNGDVVSRFSSITTDCPYNASCALTITGTDLPYETNLIFNQSVIPVTCSTATKCTGATSSPGEMKSRIMTSLVPVRSLAFSSISGTQNFTFIVPTESGTNNPYMVDFCQLVSPLSLTAQVDRATYPIYALVNKTGVASSNILVRLGAVLTSSPTIDPRYSADWMWNQADLNEEYNIGEYQYVGSLTLPQGSYYYTFRVSLDNGFSWTYCDSDGVGENFGFDETKFGVLQVIPCCS